MKPRVIIHGGGFYLPIIRNYARRMIQGRSKISVVSVGIDPSTLKSVSQTWKMASCGRDHVRFICPSSRIDKGDLRILSESDSIWFNGGDTRKYHAALSTPDVRRALRACLESGGIIGGTSAGALLLSRQCIVWGATGKDNEGKRYPLNSSVANSEYSDNAAALKLGTGFGVLEDMIVEVHATQWGRLPRLMEAMLKSNTRNGIAVDEDTFISIDAKGRYECFGKGRVYRVTSSSTGYLTEMLGAKGKLTI